MLLDVAGCPAALYMYIFGEINASNLFRGSSIGVFFFENQNTVLPLPPKKGSEDFNHYLVV
jgi:hypothetical protein